MAEAGSEPKRHILFSPREGYSAIVGTLTGNDEHRHYAMHLAFPLDGVLEVFVGATVRVVGATAVAIASGVPHRLTHRPEETVGGDTGDVESAGALIVSTAPLSRLGRHLADLLGPRPACRLESPALPRLIDRARGLTAGKTPVSEVAAALAELVADLVPPDAPDPLSRMDPRIVRALTRIGGNLDAPLSASVLASELALSESRFLHLFQQEVGLSFRRMQLWVRLVQAFYRIQEGQSLTDLAYSCGFADSAHFARSFHEAFGMPPSVLLRGAVLHRVGEG